MEDLTPKQVCEILDADHIKWGVHVLGSDEIYPSESYLTAVQEASETNATVAAHRNVDLPSWDDVRPLVTFAYAAPWPWDADGTQGSHAEALAAAKDLPA